MGTGDRYYAIMRALRVATTVECSDVTAYLFEREEDARLVYDVFTEDRNLVTPTGSWGTWAVEVIR